VRSPARSPARSGLIQIRVNDHPGDRPRPLDPPVPFRPSRIFLCELGGFGRPSGSQRNGGYRRSRLILRPGEPIFLPLFSFSSTKSELFCHPPLTLAFAIEFWRRNSSRGALHLRLVVYLSLARVWRDEGEARKIHSCASRTQQRGTLI